MNSRFTNHHSQLDPEESMQERAGLLACIVLGAFVFLAWLGSRPGAIRDWLRRDKRTILHPPSSIFVPRFTHGAATRTVSSGILCRPPWRSEAGNSQAPRTPGLLRGRLPISARRLGLFIRCALMLAGAALVLGMSFGLFLSGCRLTNRLVPPLINSNSQTH